jgi:hypothetical protein
MLQFKRSLQSLIFARRSSAIYLHLGFSRMMIEVKTEAIDYCGNANWNGSLELNFWEVKIETKAQSWIIKIDFILNIPRDTRDIHNNWRHFLRYLTERVISQKSKNFYPLIIFYLVFVKPTIPGFFLDT